MSIDYLLCSKHKTFLSLVTSSNLKSRVLHEISGLCSVFKQGKLLTVVMKPTQSEDNTNRRRWREIDAKICAKSNIGTINSHLRRIPLEQGSSSPFALQVREKLREILGMINDRSLEMEDEVREEARANEARQKRQAELDQQIGELERQLKALQLERADLGKEDVLFTQHALSSAPPLPPVLPSAPTVLDPREEMRGVQIASTDVVVFVGDVERTKTPEVGVIERPKTPVVQPVERRPAPVSRPHSGPRKYSIRTN